MQTQTAMGTPKFAGFWIRFLAFLIDSIIYSIYNIIIVLIIASIVGVASQSYHNSGLLSEAIALYLYLLPLQFVPFFYALIMQVQVGGTLGKKLVNIEIRRADNYYERIGYGASFGRLFGYILSGIPLYLGYIWAGFDPKKQAWHDKLAGTVVLYTDSLSPQIEEQPIMKEEDDDFIDVAPRNVPLPMRGKPFADIVFVKGINKGKKYVLKGDRVIFGRKVTEVHVPIKDPEKFVSKIQCEIVKKNERYYIRNLSSRDTTKLNGVTVHNPQPLRTNDIISFGHFSFKILFF